MTCKLLTDTLLLHFSTSNIYCIHYIDLHIYSSTINLNKKRFVDFLNRKFTKQIQQIVVLKKLVSFTKNVPFDILCTLFFLFRRYDFRKFM